MNIQPHPYHTPSIVKLGASRQIAIPKRLWHDLGLRSGEYMEIKKQGKELVLKPKTLVDKELEAGLAQSLKEYREGRAHGPFETVDALFAFLDGKKTKQKRSHKS